MIFKIFEKVIIRSNDKFPNYIGKEGVVIGVSRDEKNVYSYALYFLDGMEGIDCLPTDLESTGDFADRGEIYDDDDKVRVRVDGEEGSIVE